ncbi:MAG: ATP-binding protein [Dehalobacterium sp.]
MSLKHKIWASYIIMIVVPVLLAVFSARLILINYEKENRLQIIEASQDEKMKDTFIYIEELGNTILSSPDYFKDSLYLEELNEKLTAFNMGILVEYHDAFLYKSPAINGESLKSYLTKFPEQDITKRWVSAISKDYFIRCRALSFSDSTAGRLYLLMDRTAPWDSPPLKHSAYVKWIFLIFVMCICLTQSFLTYYMYKCLITPLSMVKKAAQEIQHGNMDYPISYPKQNEIGELYQTFEAMRLQLKESQALNTQYEKSRKELISNISHDLKTPITSIKGYVQGIIDGVANSPEKRDKYLRTILTKAVEMERLTNDLFLFSKLDIKQIPFSFESIDINKYFEDVREELAFTLNEKNINLTYKSYYQSDDPIAADRQRLVRVIHNIIENAKNHLNKQEKKIGIILNEEKEGVLVEIKDNGCGIPAGKIPYIFDRFYRVDCARNRATGGSGIGLSIAKEIIETHQGSIWAESAEGIGTSIFFTLKKTADFKVM